MKTYIINEEQVKVLHKYLAHNKSFERFVEMCNIKLVEETQSTPTNKVTEGEIEEMANEEYPKTFTSDSVRYDDYNYLIKQDCYIQGIRKGLSLSTQEKQPERELRDISDEDKIELCNILEENCSSFLKSLSDGFTSSEDIKVTLKAIQYLQSKGYKLPVYFENSK